jgi:hypothetical protein
MEVINDSTPEMKTLSEHLSQAMREGYLDTFVVKNNELVSLDKKSTYKPKDTKITNFFRFEGYSDPADNSILYLIETSDGKKGTLLDTYGTYADASLSNFIRQVKEISKQP